LVQADDTDACEKAAEELSNLKDIDEVGKCIAGITTEEGLEITAKYGSAVVTQVVRALDKVGVPIEQLKLTVPTLDEVFLKLTGKTLNVIERKEAVRPRGRRR
jgi:lysyl-tRNA synthetase class I